MIRVWKEVLLPAPEQYDARGRRFAITPTNVRDAFRNVQLMLSRGVPIPCIAEHLNVEAGDTEEWKARYAKNTFGHVSGARLSPRGTLELQHELRDRDALRTLERCRFVSPKIYPAYADSRGGRYRGTTIAHVAVTPTPVQFWQRPFQLSRGGLYLAYAEARSGQKCTPHNRRTDARTLSAPREGGPTVPDPKDDPKPKDGGDLNALMDALRETGMTIPDEVVDVSGLIIAVKAAGGSGGGGSSLGDDDELDLDGPAGSGATAPAGGAPMMMSTLSSDPDARAQAAEWAKDERRDITRRIKELFHSGRIDRPTARQLHRQSKAVEMSFTQDAVAVSPLHKKLTELEKKPANSVWKARDLSATREVEAPKALTGAPAATAGTTDWLCAGLPAAAKK